MMNVQEYIRDCCGVHNDEDLRDMTDADIEYYFSAENWAAMFGGDELNESEYSRHEMINAAIEIRDALPIQ